MLLICLPTCTTCKGVVKFLDERDLSYDYRDIKKDNPKREELEDRFKKSDYPIKKFFNTSGQKYRELNLKEKLQTMTDDEKLDLLATDGMLVKRPILLDGDKILIGKKDIEAYIGE